MMLRRILAFSLAAVLLSGCVSSTLDVSKKASQPIPASLVADMKNRSMSPADPIVVRIFKQESEMEIWKRDRSGRYALLKTYPMCRWSGQLGPKKKIGDRQAPEGFYHVNASMLNPNSQYYLSFNLGYPNRLESALGYTGEALMVHGACSSSGCYAMTDEGVAEIYAVAREALKGGQRVFQVQAYPFRMTPRNMAKNRGHPDYPFWQNLKRGYDLFEVTRWAIAVAATPSALRAARRCRTILGLSARPTSPSPRPSPPGSRLTTRPSNRSLPAAPCSAPTPIPTAACIRASASCWNATAPRRWRSGPRGRRCQSAGRTPRSPIATTRRPRTDHLGGYLPRSGPIASIRFVQT